MGKTKGIVFLTLGLCAFELAAYRLDQPGLGTLIKDIVYSGSLGQIIDTMLIKYPFEYYGRDFFHNGFAALGFAGQASMYGGLGNLIYHTLKRTPKTIEEKVEDK
jgi:hypothetical protein